MKQTSHIHPVDAYAGQRLRTARKLRGMSQRQLGQAISQPITFQQVQKYERGANRMSASRLYEFAQVLQVETKYFFPCDHRLPSPILNSREARLLKNYRSVSADLQSTLIELLCALTQHDA